MENLPIAKKTRNTIIAIIIGMMVIVAAILISIIMQFNLVENLVMSWILTTLYALIAFFLIDPTVQITPVKVVEKPIYQKVIEKIQIPVENRIVEVVDRPIIQPIQIPVENRIVEVVDRPIIQPIQIPVENRIVEVVEKEVIKEIKVPVEKIVYKTIEKERKKLNIPKFQFIGSTQTKTYHKRSCKFARMLKNKYKLHSNSQDFFAGKHYKACRTCIDKSKRQHRIHNKNNKKIINIITPKKQNYKEQKEHYEVCDKVQFKPKGYDQDFIKRENYQSCLV